MSLFSLTAGSFATLTFANGVYLIALGLRRRSITIYQKRHGMPWQRMFGDPVWKAPIGLRWFNAKRNHIDYEFKRINLIAIFIFALLAVVNGIMAWSMLVLLQGFGMTIIIGLMLAIVVRLK